jgi:hypothetical protein
MMWGWATWLEESRLFYREGLTIMFDMLSARKRSGDMYAAAARRQVDAQQHRARAVEHRRKAAQWRQEWGALGEDFAAMLDRWAVAEDDYADRAAVSAARWADMASRVREDAHRRGWAS